MTERPVLGVGLMSGTSLDGMDAALVRIDSPTHATLIDFVTRPYDDSERAELRTALDPQSQAGAATFARLHVRKKPARGTVEDDVGREVRDAGDNP